MTREQPSVLVVDSVLTVAYMRDLEPRGARFRLSNNVVKTADVPKSVQTMIVPRAKNGQENPEVRRVIDLARKGRRNLKFESFADECHLKELLRAILPAAIASKGGYRQTVEENRAKREQSRETIDVDPAAAIIAKLRAELQTALNRIADLEYQNDRVNERLRVAQARNPSADALFNENVLLKTEVERLKKIKGLTLSQATR